MYVHVSTAVKCFVVIFGTHVFVCKSAQPGFSQDHTVCHMSNYRTKASLLTLSQFDSLCAVIEKYYYLMILYCSCVQYNQVIIYRELIFALLCPSVWITLILVSSLTDDSFFRVEVEHCIVPNEWRLWF